MNATISIVCYKSEVLANGENPLMIRVCKNGSKKCQSLGISINPKFLDFFKGTVKSNYPIYEYAKKSLSIKAEIFLFCSPPKAIVLAGSRPVPDFVSGCLRQDLLVTRVARTVKISECRNNLLCRSF